MYKDEKTGKIKWNAEDDMLRRDLKEGIRSVDGARVFINELLRFIGESVRKKEESWIAVIDEAHKLGLINENDILGYNHIKDHFTVTPSKKKEEDNGDL